MTLVVQVNGKKRGDVTVPRGAQNPEIEAAVLALDAVKLALGGKRRPQGDRCSHEDRECRWLGSGSPLGCWPSAALAALTAGCFQPMYAERADGTPGLREKLMGVEVPPVDKPNASREARIGVEIRNALAFKLYGNATGMPPTHRLVLRFSTSRSSLMVDPTTALPTSENYGIDAQYNLIELATNKSGHDRHDLLPRVLRHSRAICSASPAPAPSATPRIAPPRRSRKTSRPGWRRSSSPAPDPPLVALRGKEIDAFLARPDPGRPIILLYGPDAGLVRERADALLASAVDDPNDPFSLVRLDGDELSAEPSRLVDEAMTVPLFGGRRAIRVRAGSRSFASGVDTLAGSAVKDCRIVIEAGELRPESPLRKACERAKTAVAIACYPDTRARPRQIDRRGIAALESAHRARRARRADGAARRRPPGLAQRADASSRSMPTARARSRSTT